jgi:3-oxoadipate enol-lactonase
MTETVNLHYYTMGQGFPLVMIHGWCSDGLGFTLQTSFAYKYQLILPDLRGHGKSPKPHAPCNAALLASDVKHLLEKTGIERAILCGGSFGGMVALQFALDYPQKVEALILSDTTSTFAASTQFMGMVIPMLSGPNAAEMVRGMISSLALGGEMAKSPFGAMLIEASLERLEDLDPGSLLEVTKGMKDFEVTPRLPEIKVPTLIIAAKRDMVVPPRFSEEMHRRIAGSEYVVIDSDHGTPFFRPDEWNRTVRNFLKKMGH